MLIFAYLNLSLLYLSLLILGCQKTPESLDISTIRLSVQRVKQTLVRALGVSVHSHHVVSTPIRDEQHLFWHLDEVACVYQAVEHRASYTEIAENTFPLIHKSVVVMIIECRKGLLPFWYYIIATEIDKFHNEICSQIIDLPSKCFEFRLSIVVISVHTKVQI